MEPKVDATSGEYSKFGWSNIESWCQQHGLYGKKAIDPYLVFCDADFLLIHLDTDVAQEIMIGGQEFEGSYKSRRDWCKKAINSWLGFTRMRPDVKYLLPTFQIETWLLATYDQSRFPNDTEIENSDYERYEQVEAMLIEKGYVKDNAKPERMYKEFTMYNENPLYLTRLLKFENTARERCRELDRFLNFYESSFVD